MKLNKNQNVFFRLLPLLVLGVVCALPPALAQTPAPATDDILNGQRYLKQTQDFSFVSVYNTSYDFLNVDVITYNTANSQFGSSTPSYQQTITSTDVISGNNQLPTQSPVGVASGRMFNTGNDQFVTLNPSLDLYHNPENDWMFHYYDPPAPNANPPRGSSLQTVRTGNDYQVPYVGGTSSAWVVMGNFRGDGLKEAFGVFANISGNGVEFGMEVLGAQPNGNNPPATDQVMAGPLFFSSSSTSQTQNFISFNQNSVAVGDFNGDGRDEVAVIMSDLQTIRFYSVDPNTYAISPMSPAVYKLSLPVYRTNLVPGRFVVPNRVDLVAVGSDAQPDNLLRFEYINTQSQDMGVFNPQQENSASSPTQPYDTGAQNTYFAYAAPLIQPGSQSSTFGPEQLVMASQYRSGQNNFWIGDFYVNQYAFTQIGYTDLGSDGCTLGMQLGNFDHQTSSGSYNAGEQVAFLYNEHGCTSGSPSLFIYSIHVPEDLTPQFQTTNWLGNSKSNITVSATGNQNAYAYPTSFTLDVSDVQGRSQELGAPQIVRIPKQIQPEVVLGMPPMAVDYVIPPNPQVCQPGTGNGTTAPCVANISFQPTPANTTEKPFTTEFKFQNTSGNSTASTATTSWGLSIKTSVGAKISFNDLESNLKLDIKDTAKQLYTSTVQQKNSSYQSSSTDIDVETTTDDYLFYTERDLIVYYYPVLGLTDGNGHDVFVEFSQPSNLNSNSGVGAGQDWYQPIQEPGNILSYPWSYNQLASQFSNTIEPVTLTQGIQCQMPGSAVTSFSSQWSTNSSQQQSLGTASSFSNDFSVSGSEGAGVSGVDGADVTFGFDIGASNSLSSLNVETATVAQSSAVTTIAPAFYNFNGDSYFLANYIFGESNPKNTSILQSLTPTIGTTPTDQVTQGPIFVNYIADPVPQLPGGSCGTSSGQSQWGAMYPLPDVGFNHPQRWSWTPNGSNMGVSFNSAIPSNPIKSHFYHMKGFFITTPANAGSGPSLTSAALGDQLALTARVYNFSLTDTTGTIYVDFYGQAYDKGTGNVSGNAFQIGEAQLNQTIPGFKSTTPGLSGPNWITASVPFNTADFNLSAGPMVFWVVTWMQDANGRVQEMTGKGLMQTPAENLTSIAQLQLEPYSNNVGVYGVHTQFNLRPALAPGATLSGAGAISEVAVSTSAQAHLDDNVDILGRFGATRGPVDSFSVSYFDGDPRKGGKLFDHQVIHHVDENGFYVHRSSYQVQSCGAHTIYAEAFPEQAASVVSKAATVNVTVDPVQWIGGMMTYLRTVDLPQQYATALQSNLKLAQGLFQQKEIGRGIGSLQVFAKVADTIGSFSGSKVKDQLTRLSGQARTINSCEGTSMLAESSLAESSTPSPQ